MRLGFEDLSGRLLHRAREAVRRGEVSERMLAKLCGYSQPHMHNVLAGVRNMPNGMADRLLAAFDLPLVELYTEQELSTRAAAEEPRSASLPLLEGALGGGRPFPRQPWRAKYLRFPVEFAAEAINPAVAVVDFRESAMWPTVSPGDLVVMDRSPALRRAPRFEDVFAVNWRGKSYLRRCQRVGQALMIALDQEPEGSGRKGPPPRIELPHETILEIVQGRIIWIARDIRATDQDLNYED